MPSLPVPTRWEVTTQIVHYLRPSTLQNDVHSCNSNKALMKPDRTDSFCTNLCTITYKQVSNLIKLIYLSTPDHLRPYKLIATRWPYCAKCKLRKRRHFNCAVDYCPINGWQIANEPDTTTWGNRLFFSLHHGAMRSEGNVRFTG